MERPPSRLERIIHRHPGGAGFVVAMASTAAIWFLFGVAATGAREGAPAVTLGSIRIMAVLLALLWLSGAGYRRFGPRFAAGVGGAAAVLIAATAMALGRQ